MSSQRENPINFHRPELPSDDFQIPKLNFIKISRFLQGIFRPFLKSPWPRDFKLNSCFTLGCKKHKKLESKLNAFNNNPRNWPSYNNIFQVLESSITFPFRADLLILIPKISWMILGEGSSFLKKNILPPCDSPNDKIVGRRPWAWVLMKKMSSDQAAGSSDKEHPFYKCVLMCIAAFNFLH